MFSRSKVELGFHHFHHIFILPYIATSTTSIHSIYIHTHAHLDLTVWLISLWIHCLALQYMLCKFVCAVSTPMSST
jgi:hypothetical protein